MTPSTVLLKGLAVLCLSIITCYGQADERWAWNDPKGQGQYTVAKTLVARREPPKQPLFQLALDPTGNRNKGRYEVFEEDNKGLGSFFNRPDRYPDDRGTILGNNPGFDRPRPGIDDRRPGFADRRPGLDSLNPDFNNPNNRPGFAVARPILPGDRPIFENRPDFNRPDLDGIRPGFDGNRPDLNGNRPDLNGNRPGFEGNRPAFGGFRPDFDNRGPEPVRPPIDLGPRPGVNRPTPPTSGGRAPGILTGPVPSWEKPIAPANKDPTDFDTCKCKHSFNCKSPGIQFGMCDVGKQYCCYSSPKYGLIDEDGKGPLLIGPRDRDFDPRGNIN